MTNFRFVVSLICALFVQPTQPALHQLCKQIDDYSLIKVYPRCLVYNGYGCWCGKGGKGTPVDTIDACCKEHDDCYKEKIDTAACNPYFTIYRYRRRECRKSTIKNKLEGRKRLILLLYR